MAEVRHTERTHGWKWAFIVFIVAFVITFSYAIVRYNVVSGVPADQIPLYIFNKAISLTSVIVIGASFIIGPFARFWPKKFVPKLYLRKYLGVLGFGVAALHGLISLLLFNSSYYPRLFTEAGKLTFSGELSMLFGILSLFIFSGVAVTSLPSVEKGMHPKQWKFVQRLGYIAFVLALLHVAVMGWKGWLNTSGWPGGLLPISMLAAAVIIFVLIVRAVAIPLQRRSK
ncbi:MAG TPA: ferric reductase-like transmembrane domain-containing protein [archaeon]|nr:ferric reductase-like transmembrane domain-containing protein [archaeon]